MFRKFSMPQPLDFALCFVFSIHIRMIAMAVRRNHNLKMFFVRMTSL